MSLSHDDKHLKYMCKKVEKYEKMTNIELNKILNEVTGKSF